jgi:hypothetical protein
LASDVQIPMWKHKKYEKKNNITPPKVNYSTIMNSNDNEVMKSQTWIQKNDYKNYQRN